MKNQLLLARFVAFFHFATSKMCLLLITLFATHTSFSQTLDWATQAFGAYSEAHGTTVDKNGNVYTTGLFQGTVDFDPGPGVFNITSSIQDIFVQKLNASGNLVWAVRLGGAGNDIGNSISVDSLGHVYVCGLFTQTADFDPGPGTFNLTSFALNDVFVVQLDTMGNFGWAKRWGSSQDDFALGITSDNSGNAYVVGSYKGTVDFDPGTGIYNIYSGGGTSAYLVKLAASGSFIFAKSVGNTSSATTNGCSITCITLDNQKNIYMAGSFGGTVDFDPGPGSFTMAPPSPTSGAACIMKLDSVGNFLWAGKIGGTGAVANASTLAADSTGNAFVSGYFSSTIDIDPGPATYNLTSISTMGYFNAFTVKLDPTGNFAWGAQLGSIANVHITGSCVDRSGSVYLSGMFAGNIDFDPGPGTFYMTAPPMTSSMLYDTYIQKLDNNGNFQSAIKIDGTPMAQTRAMAVDRKKNIYLAGAFQGTYDFDPGTGTVSLSSPSYASMFVAKYNQTKFTNDTATSCGTYVTSDATYSATGTYSDTLTASDGPDSVVTLNLTINPLPAAGTVTGVDTICKSSSTTLSASVTGGTWSVSDASLASVTAGGVVTGSVVGLDTVLYTVTDAATGCSSTVIHPIYVKNCQNNPNAAVGSVGFAMDFSIVPNPNNGHFRINAGGNNAVLSITNIEGKEVYRSEVISKEYTLSPDLAEGMYLIRLTSGNTTQVQKMIIAR